MSIYKYPMAKNGVDLRANITEHLPEDANLTQNLVWKNGISKRGGQSLLNTTEAIASKEILGIYRFYFGISKQRLIAIDTKVIKDDEDNTWTDIKTGLTTGKQTFFTPVGYDDAIFVANGTDTPFHYDGTTATDISGTNFPSTATMFLPYQDRILAIQGGALQWSASYPAIPETAVWETISACGVRPDTVLYGMVQHSISNSDAGYEAAVLLAGANGMYIFKGSDLRTPFTTGDYTIFPLATSVGCNAPRTMVWTPKGTMWLGIDRQVYLLPFGSTTPVPVGKKLFSGQSEQGIENIPATQIQFACGVYHDGYYKLAVARSAQTENNVQWWLEIDRLFITENGYYGPWFGPMLGQTISCFANQNGPGDTGELIAGEGTAKGYIYQLGNVSTLSDINPSDASTKDIEIKYKTFYNPLSFDETGEAFNKVIHDIELELLAINGTINLDFHDITGVAKIGTSFGLTSGSKTWGSFNWGDNNWDLGDKPIRQTLDISPSMKVRRLEIIITNSSSTDKFELYALRTSAIQESIIFD